MRQKSSRLPGFQFLLVCISVLPFPDTNTWIIVISCHAFVTYLFIAAALVCVFATSLDDSLFSLIVSLLIIRTRQVSKRIFFFAHREESLTKQIGLLLERGICCSLWS